MYIDVHIHETLRFTLHNVSIPIAGTQFRDIQLTKRQHDLIQYYQLNAEISEVNSLKPFVEASRDGIGVALVTGNGELLTQALSKQQDVERKQTQLDKLGSGLSVFGCDSKRASALEEGKKLLASKKRNGIREEIEMTSFSILQRTKNISRLAGQLVHCITYTVVCFF